MPRLPVDNVSRQAEPTDELVRQLIDAAGGSPHAEFLMEMIHTALRLIRNQTSRGDIKILNAALRELAYAFRVFTPYRGVPKVTIFGSARVPDDSPEYQQAALFAREMSRRGWMVITGAGEGIMKAGQDGAGRGKSFGVNIRLPFEQFANQFIQRDAKLVTFRYFFTRKLVFVKETDAFALFPGGFGTMDEAFEALTLLQTGKTALVPLVCVDPPGGDFWRSWDEHVRKMLLGRGLISGEDLALYRVTDSAETAANEIEGFYRNYHSSRYVGNRLLLRLRHAPSAADLERIRHAFGDILAEGTFTVTAALPEEADETGLADLPRLLFRFNRRNLGRLRQLIDALNRLAPPPDQQHTLVGTETAHKLTMTEHPEGTPVESDPQAEVTVEIPPPIPGSVETRTSGAGGAEDA
jgi:uncharacterized protein (TIGR00730 family)